MLWLWIVLGGLTFTALCILLISYICFRIVFLVPKRVIGPLDYVELPEGEIYEKFHPQMQKWIAEARALNPKKFTTSSFDGLKLSGKYYEYSPNAPIELMFHGYRGNAERDLSGAVQRCFNLGRSAFIVDQRGSCESEGNVITFGINEHKDCLSWIDFLINKFGKDIKIILTGISMGASTVLIASGCELPCNVIGILADCGFTSAEAIIKKVSKQMKLSPTLTYPFIKLGAKIFGKFDLDETSAIEAVKKSKTPTFILHGEDDDFVPCYMSRELYDSCAARKRLFTVKGAGHGLGYLVDTDGYMREIKEFFNC